jgi:hypothetical protein
MANQQAEVQAAEALHLMKVKDLVQVDFVDKEAKEEMVLMLVATQLVVVAVVAQEELAQTQ